jgi:nucleotide-binding universal stress UspA family protein
VFHIGVGEVADIIVRYAQDQKCDQLVMGIRGMGALSNMIMGSVATKVLHLSDMPVLCVK